MKNLITHITLIGLVLFGLVVLPQQGFAASQKAALLEFGGDVRIWKEATKGWVVPTPEGAEFKDGDRIVAGDNSYAIVTFDAEGQDTMRIENGSQMIFRNLFPQDTYIQINGTFVRLKAISPGDRFTVVMGSPATAYDIARRGDMMVVAGQTANLIVFAVGDQTRGGAFYPQSWWGSSRVFQ